MWLKLITLCNPTAYPFPFADTLNHSFPFSLFFLQCLSRPNRLNVFVSALLNHTEPELNIRSELEIANDYWLFMPKIIYIYILPVSNPDHSSLKREQLLSQFYS